MFKPILILLVSFSIFSFSPKSTDSQQELIIHFENLSEKDVSQVQTLLTGINGLHFIDYCEKHKVFLLTYDDQTYTNVDFAIKAITNSNPDLRPVQMTGNSVEKVSNDCNH